MHDSCTILGVAAPFHPAFLEMTPLASQTEVNTAPLKRRTQLRRSIIEHKLDLKFSG